MARRVGLLQHGEAGYAKIVELAAHVPERSQLWRAEELVAGPVLGALTENLEEVLDFVLYLDERPGGPLPEILADFQKAMMHEAGVMLLGFYAGENAALLDRFVEKYRRELAKQPLGEHRYGRDMVRALGQIRTDASFQLLDELLANTEGREQRIIIEAMAWQAHEQSLDRLERLRARRSNDEDNDTLDAAIRFLTP